MSRKRKKKERALEMERLQVELLALDETSVEDVEETGEDIEETGEAGVEPGSAVEAANADGGHESLAGSEAQAPDARKPIDRWARAVGRFASKERPAPIGGPTVTASEESAAAESASEGSESSSEASARAEREDVASGEDASPAPPLRRDVHRSARDHAAATVRPAGEPLARARELVEAGRIHEAMELYLGILTVNPQNVKARNNLGVLLDGLKQWEAALEHFEEAERLAPESVEVLANYAATLTSLARYDEAEALLRRAQRLDAEDTQARLGIAILFFRRGLYAQAEGELRAVCSRDEDNGPAFYYRGEALNRLGRYEEAESALSRAAALLPNDPRVFYTLGHLYDRKNQAEEAAEMYRTARRLQDR